VYYGYLIKVQKFQTDSIIILELLKRFDAAILLKCYFH